ncbi:MAG TPA: adenosine deaminase [Pedococcus sp.]|nr:adenosine deaminase [Pedococcus sp.]
MSDQPGTESIEDDLGSYSVDDAVDSGSGQEELLDASEGDNEPWSPPDRQPRNTEWGTTASEQAQDESIDQRLAQEQPDPQDRVGGEDTDAIAVLDDWLGDAEVVPDDGPGDGSENEREDGPEAAAMHIVAD